MSSPSGSDTRQGLAPVRTGQSQSGLPEGSNSRRNSIDVNVEHEPHQHTLLPDSSDDLPLEDGIDRVSHWAAQVGTLFTDSDIGSTSIDDHTDHPSHPFRDESFPPPDEGSVASRAEAYAEAYLGNQNVEFEALLTEPDTPEGRFERQARSLALDLLQHYAPRLNLGYPEETIFFQVTTDRVPIRARGNGAYAYESHTLNRPHRRYQAALFRVPDHGSSSSGSTSSNQSFHEGTPGSIRPLRLREAPPQEIRRAAVVYVTRYLAGQDEIVEWAARGDFTGIPYFLRLDQPGTPDYDASSDARIWALDILELMAWERDTHPPHPAAFFADYDELMRHAHRWQFQFPYTQAIVNGEETSTPVRSGGAHPELGPRPRMTLSISSVDSNESGIDPLINGREYGPIPDPGQFRPQRMLDLYNNFIENPEEYWNNDERILTFDEPLAAPPYGSHEQDDSHPANETLADADHIDTILAVDDNGDLATPHGAPPSYRTSGPRHPHLHTPPPPTTQPRLNLLGEPITPRNSPPHVPFPPGPGAWGPEQDWAATVAAALHFTVATPSPPSSLSLSSTSAEWGSDLRDLTIRNGLPSPEGPSSEREDSPPRPADIAASLTPASLDTRATALTPPSTVASTPLPERTQPADSAMHTETPPTGGQPTTPVMLPHVPDTTLSPLLLPPPHIPLPDSPPPLFAPPPSPQLTLLTDSALLIPLPDSPLFLSPHLIPLPDSLPSSPVLPTPPIPPRNPNRSGLFGQVPRFPLHASDDDDDDAEAPPASPPPGYTSRETSPPSEARGNVQPQVWEAGVPPMTWPDVGRERMREWGMGRFVERWEERLRVPGERTGGGVDGE
ncbi:hypothetical protein MMC11_008029, partial [Xylographa trunciseda]|nr:hypothetical protein [Xylographa trunciseda]